MHTNADTQYRHLFFADHALQGRTHTRGIEPFHGMVERADSRQNKPLSATEIICLLGDAYRNVQALVDVDERLNVTQSVIDDRDHLNSLLSKPKALITREPTPMRKRLFR
ncbi:hypothetical protein D3C76_1356710 [compost metagenome]